MLEVLGFGHKSSCRASEENRIRKKAKITMERKISARKFLQQPQPKFKRCWMTQKSLLWKAKTYKILFETMV